MNIYRLQHTSIPMPPGGNETARQFYSGILGLKEIPAPSTLARERLVWFLLSDDGDELHLLTEDGSQPGRSGQHLCMVVHDLQAVRQQLESAGIMINEEPLIAYRPRFSFRDPFGNKIEVTEINGDYLDAEK